MITLCFERLLTTLMFADPRTWFPFFHVNVWWTLPPCRAVDRPWCCLSFYSLRSRLPCAGFSSIFVDICKYLQAPRRLALFSVALFGRVDDPLIAIFLHIHFPSFSCICIDRHTRESIIKLNECILTLKWEFSEQLIDPFHQSMMFDDNSTQEEDTVPHNFESDFSRQFKFFLFLPLQLSSIPTSIFVLYHLFTIPALRRSLPNHVLIALNIVTLIDVIFQQTSTMIFFRLNRVWPESNGYCIFWNYLDFTNYALNLHLTVWALFERQVFIFDPNFCRTRRRRQLFHFLPLSAIITYAVTFNLGLIVLNPCKNIFDFTESWCGDLCFLENNILYFFDWIFNGLVPIFLIVILSAALFIRVIRQRNRVYQSFVWSKHRKLTIQLLSLSSLYMVCFLPSIINALIAKIVQDPMFGIVVQTVYLDYLPILGRSITPFLSLATLPELSKKIKNYFTRCCRVAVAPLSRWRSNPLAKIWIEYKILFFYSFHWIDTIQRNPPRGDAREERKRRQVEHMHTTFDSF